MLPDLTLPASLLAVLENLRGSFTAPTFVDRREQAPW